MIFRGTFLGLPVYSPEITDTDTAKSDATVVVRHEATGGQRRPNKRDRRKGDGYEDFNRYNRPCTGHK
jgi:hypothetical protein